MQDVGHLYQVKPGAAQKPAANQVKQSDGATQKLPSKVKKDLKPSKKGAIFFTDCTGWLFNFMLFIPVLLLLEKEAKEKERRTCRVCGKKESAHRHVFITCAECVKKSFPKKLHYCSKVCQSKR
jgi:hypothetical protein